MENKPISEHSHNIKDLLKELEKRFLHLEKFEQMFNIFNCPFNIDMNSAPVYRVLILISFLLTLISFY